MVTHHEEVATEVAKVAKDEEAKDEKTGEKYAIAVGKKGAGQCRELDWLIKGMVDELKSAG